VRIVATALLAVMAALAHAAPPAGVGMKSAAGATAAGPVDLRIRVTLDHAFLVGEQRFDAKGLEAALARTEKDRGIDSVRVTGDFLTVYDLVTIARMGKRIGFQTEAVIEGQLKTITIAD
jgi:hypothetical protein